MGARQSLDSPALAHLVQRPVRPTIGVRNQRRRLDPIEQLFDLPGDALGVIVQKRGERMDGQAPSTLTIEFDEVAGQRATRDDVDHDACARQAPNASSSTNRSLKSSRSDNST